MCCHRAVVGRGTCCKFWDNGPSVWMTVCFEPHGLGELSKSFAQFGWLDRGADSTPPSVDVNIEEKEPMPYLSPTSKVWEPQTRNALHLPILLLTMEICQPQISPHTALGAGSSAKNGTCPRYHSNSCPS